MKFSKINNGFYDPSFHSDIPSDAVEITNDMHLYLLDAQASGKRISSDSDGYPIAVDPPELVRTQASLLSEVATKRYQVETGGISVDGIPISTDRESQAQLSSSYNSLRVSLISDTYWKASDGNFTLVTLSELELILKSVSEHVRACFFAEHRHVEAISSLQTQAEFDSYNINAWWPANS